MKSLMVVILLPRVDLAVNFTFEEVVADLVLLVNLGSQQLFVVEAFIRSASLNLDQSNH